MGTVMRGGVRRRTLAVAATGVLLGAGLGFGAPQASAQAAAPPSGTGTATAPRASTVVTTTTVGYSCFVTFQGGTTTVTFGLGFTGTAPDTVLPYQPFSVQIDAPVITPRTDINLAVQGVRVVYRVPDGAHLIGVRQSGGSGLGTAGAQVSVESNSVVLTAAGPMPSGQPFQLPSVTLYLIAGASGSQAVSQGGLTLADPAFSWIRTDPSDGTLRPFACFVPAPVPLTTTTVAGG